MHVSHHVRFVCLHFHRAIRTVLRRISVVIIEKNDTCILKEKEPCPNTLNINCCMEKVTHKQAVVSLESVIQWHKNGLYGAWKTIDTSSYAPRVYE